MEPLFNNLRSITLRLKKGLHTPNPSNPDRPMWTLEDLDEIAEGSKYNIDQAKQKTKDLYVLKLERVSTLQKDSLV